MKLRRVLLALTVAGCAADIKAPPAPPPSITANFDPLATPAQIPLPNDLAKTGGDGTHLNVPDAPTDSPAQVDFNHYLNSLDGFPSSTPGSFSFSGAIDPASLTVGTPSQNGSVLVFNATGSQPLGPDDYKLSLSADGTSVTITPTLRWASASQYVVVLFGGSDADGLKGATGETVLASPAFFFLRSPIPVEVDCKDVSMACPADVVAKGDPTDSTCCSALTGLSDAQARQLEGGRQTLDASLTELLPFAGSTPAGPRDRNNVVLMWSFTIASAPMAVFDPTRGDVPFPNDVLINQTTALVNVPIAAGDPEASIKMGLNALDGFSTSAPETLDIDSATDLDPATVIPATSALLLGVTSVDQPGDFSAAPVFVNQGMTFANQIAITPNVALESDQVRYAAAVTTDVTDVSGAHLLPPPIMVLVRGKNPLVDSAGHSTVPSVLADSDAAQLEVLRQAEAPLFDQLDSIFMLPREKIAAAWTFTTESIARPLSAMNELPSKAGVSTDVTITHISDTAELAAKASQLVFPVTHLGGMVFGQMITQRAADPTTGVIQFSRDTLDATARFAVQVPATAPVEPVSFVLSVPKTGGPWPVVILQHGLGRWRGDMTLLTDGFAAAGWASIMIDLPFHGSRSVCTADSDCAGGVAGSCNTMTGQCSAASGGLALVSTADDALACAIAPLTGVATDCRPVASGAAFVNPNNLFASRDNLRQFVADAAQLIRVLSDEGNGAGLFHQLIAPGLAGYDPTQLAYLGQSLGGICGAVFLSVAPEPRVGVLNVTGGHLFDIIADGSYAPLVQPLLTSLNVQPDTAAYLQLAATARWVLDPVDPFAVARNLVHSPVTAYTTGTRNAPKLLIQQEAGMDATILPPFQQQLANSIFGSNGLDGNGHVQGKTAGGAFVSTYFPDAQHGSLLAVPPMSSTASEQAQAVGWILVFGRKHSHAMRAPMKILSLMTVLMLPGVALAGGFELLEQSPAGVGTAGAQTATVDDAGSVFYNPARMTYEQGLELLGAVNVLHTSTHATPPAGDGKSASSTITTAAPTLYGVQRIGSRFAIGLGGFSNMAEIFKWPGSSDFAGRFLGYHINLTTLTLNASVAFRPLPWLALGFGLDIVPASFELGQALPFGAAEGAVHASGSTTGVGANVGLFVRAVPRYLELGFSYRSAVDLDFTGHAALTVPPELASMAPAFQNAKTSVTLPHNFTIGVGTRPAKHFSIDVDVHLVMWEALKSLALTLTVPNDASAPATTQAQPLNFSFSYGVRVGLEYRPLDERLRLRIGGGYDRSPAPSNTLGPLSPDADRGLVSAGLGYHAGVMGFDVSYMAVILMDRTSTNPAFPAKYSSIGHVIALGVMLHFDEFGGRINEPAYKH